MQGRAVRQPRNAGRYRTLDRLHRALHQPVPFKPHLAHEIAEDLVIKAECVEMLRRGNDSTDGIDDGRVGGAVAKTPDRKRGSIFLRVRPVVIGYRKKDGLLAARQG